MGVALALGAAGLAVLGALEATVGTGVTVAAGLPLQPISIVATTMMAVARGARDLRIRYVCDDDMRFLLCP